MQNRSENKHEINTTTILSKSELDINQSYDVYGSLDSNKENLNSNLLHCQIEKIKEDKRKNNEK